MDAQTIEQTVSALRTRQAEVAEDIRQTEQRLYNLRLSYSALTETLKLFDPNGRPYARPRRSYRRAWLPGGQKLTRLVLDVLRASQRPMTAPDIAAAIVSALGCGQEATPAVGARLSSTLRYLARKRGNIVREGEGRDAKWSLRR